MGSLEIKLEKNDLFAEIRFGSIELRYRVAFQDLTRRHLYGISTGDGVCRRARRVSTKRSLRATLPLGSNLILPRSTGSADFRILSVL